LTLVWKELEPEQGLNVEVVEEQLQLVLAIVLKKFVDY